MTWHPRSKINLRYNRKAFKNKTYIFKKKGVSVSLFLKIAQNCILQLFSVLLRIWVEMGACSITCFSCIWYVKTKRFKSKGTDKGILPWFIKKMVSCNFLLFRRGHINTENIHTKLIRSRQVSKVNFTFYLSAVSNQQELLPLFARFSIYSWNYWKKRNLNIYLTLLMLEEK